VGYSYCSYHCGIEYVPLELPWTTSHSILKKVFISGNCLSKKDSAGEKAEPRSALGCKEVMEFLETSELMKTVKNLGKRYEKLVKEFIINIIDEYTEGSEEFNKVYVRGKL
jgi:hypothetical protein